MGRLNRHSITYTESNTHAQCMAGIFCDNENKDIEHDACSGAAAIIHFQLMTSNSQYSHLCHTPDWQYSRSLFET